MQATANQRGRRAKCDICGLSVTEQELKLHLGECHLPIMFNGGRGGSKPICVTNKAHMGREGEGWGGWGKERERLGENQEEGSMRRGCRVGGRGGLRG